MSAKATFWAWEQNIDGFTKLVLLSLANYANDEDESWHSYARIAKATGISRVSVINHCKKLEQMGLLVIKKRRIDENKNLTNVFKLVIRGSTADLLGSKGDLPEVVKEVYYTSKGALPKTNNKTKNKTNNIVSDETFENFWSFVKQEWKKSGSPIGGKSTAQKAFSKACVTKFGKIKTRAAEHSAAVAKMKQSGSNINLPNVSTWLNQERWEQPATDFYSTKQSASSGVAERDVVRRSAVNGFAK